jgi:hypothetical protein
MARAAPAIFCSQVLLESPNRLGVMLARSWLTATLALVPILAFRLLAEQALEVLALIWLLGSFALGLGVRGLVRIPHRTEAQLRIDKVGLWIDGTLEAGRREIVAGITCQAANGGTRDVVCLQLRRFLSVRHRHLVFALPHASRAAFLAATRPRTSSRLYRVTFHRAHALWEAILPVGLFLVLSNFFLLARARLGGFTDGHAATDNLGAAVLPFLLAAALALLSYILLTHTTVEVGSDGIVIGRTLHRRAVDLRDVQGVTDGDTALVVGLATGESISVAPSIRPLRVHGFVPPPLAFQRAFLRERILEAIRQRRQQVAEASAISALGRSARGPNEWFAALRGVGLGVFSYRHSVVRPCDIRRVLADAGAPSDARVGAAVALRIAGDAGAVRRIRRAAAKSAATQLRKDLATIADAKAEELAQILASSFG